MEKIKEFFKKDQFARHVNIEIVQIKEGWSRVRMDVDKKHLNGIGTVHGGVLFTLADFAFAVAANSYERVTVAINANISFMKAAGEGVLFAEAREISRNPKISSYTVDITDEEGELLAIFQGMAYEKRMHISDL